MVRSTRRRRARGLALVILAAAAWLVAACTVTSVTASIGGE